MQNWLEKLAYIKVAEKKKRQGNKKAEVHSVLVSCSPQGGNRDAILVFPFWNLLLLQQLSARCSALAVLLLLLLDSLESTRPSWCLTEGKNYNSNNSVFVKNCLQTFLTLTTEWLCRLCTQKQMIECWSSREGCLLFSLHSGRRQPEGILCLRPERPEGSGLWPVRPSPRGSDHQGVALQLSPHHPAQRLPHPGGCGPAVPHAA